METIRSFFLMWIESSAEASYWCMNLFLPGPQPLHAPDRLSMQGKIPLHLRTEYRLLHLQAGASLDEVRTQYRNLAKRSHPDAGGNHADFLALRQAYEQVVEYLQTRRWN